MKYLTLSLLFFSMIGYSQNRILVDGIFDEWSDYPITYSDAAGDGGFLGVDFGELQIYNDDEFIFFVLEFGSEINLQDMNEISMYLDTDNNSNTGFAINGIGAELVYSFGDRSGLFYHSAGASPISHPDIGLVTAPTVSSDQFEIAIKRNISIAGNPVFSSDNVKIVFQNNITNGDFLPATNEEVIYTFSNDVLEPLPDYSIQKSNESDLRILSYNVLSNGLFDTGRLPSLTRLLQAMQPDIIGFQEIYSYSSAEVANQMESILPSSAGQEWYHAKAGPDCHAISKYPILKNAEIQGSGNGAFLIDLPDTETNLFLIVAHPPCCANNVERQFEIDLMMEFLREAKAGNEPIPLEANTPIVIVGDMNLVGFNRQLETLLTGDILDEVAHGSDFNPDWDGNNLLDSRPYVPGLPLSYTWYSEGSDFSPGNLDYIIYSGSNLILQNSYSLFTPSLPQDSLNAFNLLTNDAVNASDHLPVVADFELKNLTSVKNPVAKNDFGILQIYPNPSQGLTEIWINNPRQDFIAIQLIDLNGREVSMLHQGNLNVGEHMFRFDTSTFPSGMYFIQVKTAALTDAKKIIIN
ncbi:MAG: endonuclease/exonuclease/phosphatase family protein [Saprospiraceae bacterium]